MKIIFAGTPEFAAVALKALYDAGHEITLVLTQPDRPAGRGLQLNASAVKQFALMHNIPVAQPVSLRLEGKYPDIALNAHTLLQATPHDVMIVAAYGLILPHSILKIPTHGCINIHGSILPRWRGAAPIHRAIEAGDIETGVTIMQMEQGLDTGPMMLIERINIAETDTTGILHDKLAMLGARMIVDAIGRLEKNHLTTTPQPEAGVTYAAKVTKEEAALDFSLSADILNRKIRAFNPFPGAFATFGGVILKIWGAEVVAKDNTNAEFSEGQIISADAQNGLVVACGKNSLRLTVLQKPGGKRLAATEFMRAFPMINGRFD